MSAGRASLSVIEDQRWMITHAAGAIAADGHLDVLRLDESLDVNGQNRHPRDHHEATPSVTLSNSADLTSRHCSLHTLEPQLLVPATIDAPFVPVSTHVNGKNPAICCSDAIMFPALIHGTIQ